MYFYDCDFLNEATYLNGGAYNDLRGDSIQNTKHFQDKFLQLEPLVNNPLL